MNQSYGDRMANAIADSNAVHADHMRAISIRSAEDRMVMANAIADSNAVHADRMRAISIQSDKESMANANAIADSRRVVSTSATEPISIDSMNVRQLHTELAASKTAFAALTNGDQVDQSIIASTISHIEHLIMKKIGSTELSQLMINFSNAKLREVIDRISEPDNKFRAAIVVVNNRKYFQYPDGTVSSSASMTHTKHLTQAKYGDANEFVESNKCFFIQIWKFYADHWLAMGIMSPTALLVEFRNRGGIINSSSMMNDLAITKFTNMFDITLRVNIVDLDLNSTVDYRVIGNGEIHMYVNLHERGNHYINGAE